MTELSRVRTWKELCESLNIPTVKWHDLLESLKEFARTHKRSYWDPISSACVLFLVVLVFTDIDSYARGALYQGGFADMSRDWEAQPVIKMEWVKQDKGCPIGWQEPPYFDDLFNYVKGAKPRHAQQQRLCILRGGLVSDVRGQPERPRSHCEASDTLQTCMTGKFPYCGKKGVACPLVDVADFMKDDKTAKMRHTCTTRIPSAYLPWAGCRPIVQVVVASAPPCLKYDKHGWGSYSGSAREGISPKKCVRRDTRYRFVKALPFESADGRIVADTPDSGVYYRNELFFSPTCAETQDKFATGSVQVEHLLNGTLPVVAISAFVTMFVGCALLVLSKEDTRQTLHLDFTHHHFSMTVAVIIACRLVCFFFALANFVSMVFYTDDYFQRIANDETCVDPLLGGFVQDFLRDIIYIRLKLLGCIIGLGLQLFMDFYHAYTIWKRDDIKFARSNQLSEAAPLFRPLPTESQEHVAERKGIKYVYVDRNYPAGTIPSRS